jgi:hypothetical protein
MAKDNSYDNIFLFYLHFFFSCMKKKKKEGKSNRWLARNPLRSHQNQSLTLNRCVACVPCIRGAQDAQVANIGFVTPVQFRVAQEYAPSPFVVHVIMTGSRTWYATNVANVRVCMVLILMTITNVMSRIVMEISLIADR